MVLYFGVVSPNPHQPRGKNPFGGTNTKTHADAGAFPPNPPYWV